MAPVSARGFPWALETTRAGVEGGFASGELGENLSFEAKGGEEGRPGRRHEKVVSGGVRDAWRLPRCRAELA